jgi:hypothetical protein
MSLSSTLLRLVIPSKKHHLQTGPQALNQLHMAQVEGTWGLAAPRAGASQRFAGIGRRRARASTAAAASSATLEVSLLPNTLLRLVIPNTPSTLLRLRLIITNTSRNVLRLRLIITNTSRNVLRLRLIITNTYVNK